MTPTAHLWLGLLLLALAAPVLGAQQPGALHELALRVTAARPGGQVIIDRGQRDGLANGDIITIVPRDGATLRGTVIQLAERSAIVELHESGARVPVGARGQVRIPASRLAPPPSAQPPTRNDPTPRPPPPTAPDTPDAPQAGDPRWTNRDPDWRAGMPLLAQVRPVRPAERPRRMRGRVALAGAIDHNSYDSFDNSFARAGVEFDIENPFGRGGALFLDAELEAKTEHDDTDGLDLLAHRLSYARGGTRFQPTRWQVGRFLHDDLPELGVVDGAQVSHRGADGQRFGASFGYLPELDDEFDSFADLQASIYYQWAADTRERFTAAAAYQKTLHHGKTDRDLVVLKSRYLPDEGWQAHASAWVDFYYGRDDTKGSGPEISQALVSLTRRWQSGSGIDATYRRVRFPEILRVEFVPLPTAPELRDYRYDRLTLSGWRVTSPGRRVRLSISGWDDEDDDGAAIETGVDAQGVWSERGRLELAVFGNAGQFSSVIGSRVRYGVHDDNGSWEALYELSHHHLRGFDDDADDLFQHRAHCARTFLLSAGAVLSLSAQALFWDEDTSWSVGIHVDRSF